MSKIQSLLFNKKYFNIRSAVEWLIYHGYKHYKVDVTRNYIRFRQFDPSPYKRYRLIELNNSIKAVVEF